MIKRAFHKMLLAQIMSSLAINICLLIDNIMISRYLGVKAIAAYGFCNVMLLFFSAVACMLLIGTQAVCSRALGRGSQEEANRVYSSSIVLVVVLSAIFVIGLLTMREPLARALGAGEDPIIFANATGYMLGYVFGIPAYLGMQILAGFMQLSGKGRTVIRAVVIMAIVNFVGNAVGLFVFHGGTFVIGLTAAISYYAALLVMLPFFLSRACVFRFSLGSTRLKIWWDLFVGGAPTLATFIALSQLSNLLNHMFLDAGGSDAVAAYAVVSSISVIATCPSNGMNATMTAMTGILYCEEDRQALAKLFWMAVRASVVIGLATTAVAFLFAPSIIGFFIPEDAAVRELAIFGLRTISWFFPLCCINNIFKGSYQASRHVVYSVILSVAEAFFASSLCAIVFRTLFGARGIWGYFLGGDILVLLITLVYAWIKCGRLSLRAEDLLLLPRDLGVEAEDMIELRVKDIDSAIEASVRAKDFFSARGVEARRCNTMALCLEEMATSIVTHGFADGKQHHLFIRAIDKDDLQILRFRDDCSVFDPINYVPKQTDEVSAIGIRIVMSMASDVRYAHSLNMNNLVVVLKED